MTDVYVRTLLTVSTVLLIIVLGVLFFREPSTVPMRLDRIESQLEFQSCLLLFEPAERQELTIAACQGE